MPSRLIVPIHTDTEGNPQLFARHVAALARHLAAEVDAMPLVEDFPKVSSPLGNLFFDVPESMARVKAACRARAAEYRRCFTAELAPSSVVCRWEEIECFSVIFGDLLAQKARYYDAAAVEMAPVALRKQTAEALLFGSGRPVILLPIDSGEARLEHVLIAWDGSRAAARAVADAYPFLVKASRVSIASAVDEKPLAEHTAGAELARSLAVRGIAATVSDIQCHGRSIGRALQDHAGTLGAGLLVMGGYGHTRVREFVLGGATREILDKPRVPTLLSH